MKYKYCPQCGGELEIRDSWDEGGVPYCKNDDIMFFDLPKPCIVVAVMKGDEVLLLKQSYIYKNSKVLLSGYVGIDETVEESVRREVKEEAGVEISHITYLGSDFVPNKELLMLTYVAQYESGELKKSDEVEGIEWVNIDCALVQMEEDLIGKKVINKIINKEYEQSKVAFKSYDNIEEL
ncbi:MAG: NAD(+) diphosphatase [Sarcina sp.]